jgi:NAD(P)-dependent dehydrogenase (short-subunit alcohol dehydrogenase family)
MPEMRADPANIIVAGGSGGIGRALVDSLLQRFPEAQISASFYHAKDCIAHERLNWHQVDLRDADAIERWAAATDQADWVLNAAGYLHGDHGGPEKSIRHFDADFLMENIRINTLPTLLLARSFGTALKRSAAPVLATVSARVGSIEDNRLGGWYSYRISKAALNMALKTLSIEWKHSHRHGCVAALHPGTNDTSLSKPYQANVAAPDLFDPAYTAASFVDLLSRLGPADSGRFWAWNGDPIPW